jgi:hypothetical protein
MGTTDADRGATAYPLDLEPEFHFALSTCFCAFASAAATVLAGAFSMIRGGGWYGFPAARGPGSIFGLSVASGVQFSLVVGLKVTRVLAGELAHDLASHLRIEEREL